MSPAPVVSLAFLVLGRCPKPWVGSG